METPSGIYGIKTIFFELSNICNYSYLHKACPLHVVKNKATIPTYIVKKTIDELGEINYSGVIAFHCYNEPLIDPRLFYLTRYAKDICNNAIIRITTNGFYLTQELSKELYNFGVGQLIVSIYSTAEKERIKLLFNSEMIKNYKIEISMQDMIHRLDGRRDIYTREPISCSLPCYSLTSEIIIRHTGDVCLCCLDFDSKFVYGNLAIAPLKDILVSESVKAVQSKLSTGERFLEICKRCNWQRLG